MNDIVKVSCFGEVLWDVFPDKKRLGGAPLNVAARLQSIGAKSCIISAIGKDVLGNEALTRIKELGVDINHIQQSNTPTGEVIVSFIDKNTPEYKIKESVAWDNIATTEENLSVVSDSDAFIFGSLAMRETFNRETLKALMAKSKCVIFDLNLRKPFYDIELILHLMKASHIVKMNDEELSIIAKALNLKIVNEHQLLEEISEISSTDKICITKGKDGAILYDKGNFYEKSSFDVNVIDTVGSGDSFLAGLVYGILTKKKPLEALTLGMALGGLVASKRGANPLINESEILNLINQC